jgi:hypothetical protein
MSPTYLDWLPLEVVVVILLGNAQLPRVVQTPASNISGLGDNEA